MAMKVILISVTDDCRGYLIFVFQVMSLYQSPVLLKSPRKLSACYVLNLQVELGMNFMPMSQKYRTFWYLDFNSDSSNYSSVALFAYVHSYEDIMFS